MAELDDLFLDEEPAPSLAVPRKGRLQKGRSALPETKPPQRKKEGLGRKRPLGRPLRQQLRRLEVAGADALPVAVLDSCSRTCRG